MQVVAVVAALHNVAVVVLVRLGVETVAITRLEAMEQQTQVVVAVAVALLMMPLLAAVAAEAA
jgi:putative Ca2+/H+ antiporter (TMEM165/GDT1 family)